MTLPIIAWDQAFNRNGDRTLQRAVINAIRTYMHNETLTGWVKAETLMQDTGLKMRTVREQIAACVAAGWLEVVESGNSSGKANTYRLTYPPNSAVHRTLEDDKDRAVERTVEEEPCATAHQKGAVYRTPTTPRTSPQREVLSRTTSEENRAVHRTVSDPWESFPQPESATESDGAVHRTLDDDADHAPQRMVSRSPFPPCDPWCDHTGSCGM